MNNTKNMTHRVPASLAGKRLDQALAELFPQYSRSRLKQWVQAGQVLVEGQILRPRDIVREGQQLIVTPVEEVEVADRPQPLPLEILYEDDELLVINKQAGQVVHPAAGHRDGTLLNALLHHAPELQSVPRAGIVHRLDKDTSGVLVVARNLRSQKYLVDLLQARDIDREYDAVTLGVMTGGGKVDAPIGRHPVQRKKMAVNPRGKPAVTHYRVQERFRNHTLIRAKLETGRTHQIRVHMAHINHPLVGDPLYAGRLRLPPDCSDELQQALRSFRRQALHAAHLGFRHPVTEDIMTWDVPIPEDMQNIIELLRQDMDEHAQGKI
jgi:23S rRNA pseudouridine1911/1915/1917 synthase